MIFLIATNKMQLFLIFFFSKIFNCFGRFLRPSSGAHNCTYSFRYCEPKLLQPGIVDEMEHLPHMLLMMGGGTARNMYSFLEINNQKQLDLVGFNYKIILTMHRHVDIKFLYLSTATRFVLQKPPTGHDYNTFKLGQNTQKFYSHVVVLNKNGCLCWTDV